MRIKPGLNVSFGKDFTLYALNSGTVKFDDESRNFKRINVI
jgi:ribosomal protein L27